MNPCAHLCILEFLLLSRSLLSRSFASYAPSRASATMWNVEIHNTALTRLTYESGSHSMALVFNGMDISWGRPSTSTDLRLKSPKLVWLCDTNEIGLFQVLLFKTIRLIALFYDLPTAPLFIESDLRSYQCKRLLATI